MITVEKLAVFRKFDGDEDGLVLGGTKADKAAITSEEWAKISLLLHKLSSVKGGRASREFSARIQEELSLETADDEARRLLWDMA